MDFFHCNLCYATPTNASARKYYFSSCGHTFCSHCFTTEPQMIPLCPVCKKGAKIIEMNKNMPSSVAQYFSNARNEFRKCVRALTVQNAHNRIIAQEYYPRLGKALSHFQTEMERKKVQEATLKEQIAELKAKMEQLRSDINFKRAGLVSSPSTSPSPQGFDGNLLGRSGLGCLSKTPIATSVSRPLSAKSPWAEPQPHALRMTRNFPTPGSVLRSSCLDGTSTSSNVSSVPSFWRGSTVRHGNLLPSHPAFLSAADGSSNKIF